MRHIVFEAGETIFSEGDPSEQMFRITAGSVDIIVTNRDGEETRVASLGPDEVFGEMGIIDPGPRSATAVAREQTGCDVYTTDEVMALMTSEPGEAMELLKSLIIRLRNTNRKLSSKSNSGPPRKPSSI